MQLDQYAPIGDGISLREGSKKRRSCARDTELGEIGRLAKGSSLDPLLPEAIFDVKAVGAEILVKEKSS